MATVTAQIAITRKLSASEKLKVRAALGRFSWVSCVEFETPFDEPEVHVEHSRGGTGRSSHKAMQELAARLEQTIPGITVNG